MHFLARTPALLLLALPFLVPATARAQRPPHVWMAYRYMANVNPANNEYASPMDIWFEDGQLHAHTMCGSYAAQLHKAAYSTVDNSVFTGLFNSTSPNAQKWYDGLVANNVFVNQDGQFETTTIPFAGLIQSGDVLAAKYQSGAATGHVMVVDEMQYAGIEQLSPGKIPGLSEAARWEVTIHDSTKNVHGQTDSRYEADANNQHDKGLGMGQIAIFAHPDTGEIVGWKWRADAWTVYQCTDSNESNYRPMVAGAILGPGLP